jgi:hypothetical protein
MQRLRGREINEVIGEGKKDNGNLLAALLIY